MNAPLPLVATTIAPAKLAHLVFRTNQLATMVDWYCTVLGARVAHADDKISFITYDDEHHRVAFVATAPYAPKPEKTTVGFYHVAFTYRGIGELLSTYQRLKGREILPWRAIHHGPTCSMYYRDPDRNDVELQVDSFADAESASAYMRGEAFGRDPIGILFNPDELVAKYQSGVPEADLVRRPDADYSEVGK